MYHVLVQRRDDGNVGLGTEKEGEEVHEMMKISVELDRILFFTFNRLSRPLSSWWSIIKRNGYNYSQMVTWSVRPL